MQAEPIGILRGGKCFGGIRPIGECTAHGRVHPFEPALQGIGIVHALHPQLAENTITEIISDKTNCIATSIDCCSLPRSAGTLRSTAGSQMSNMEDQ